MDFHNAGYRARYCDIDSFCAVTACCHTQYFTAEYTAYFVSASEPFKRSHKVARVLPYCSFHIFPDVHTTAQYCESNCAFFRHSRRIRSFDRSSCTADVDGETHVAFVVELCMETGFVEPAPAE